MSSSALQPHAEASLALVLDRNTSLVSATLRGAAEAADPMRALSCARTAAEAMEQATHALVGQARAAGSTWQEIGELLAITRQAAQQRFGQSTIDPADAAVMERAAEIVAQMDAGEWDRVTTDWDEVMRRELGPERVRDAWSEIGASAGRLEAVGRGSIVPRGPYRIVDVPLIFTHGPMKARVVFRHDAKVSGLFLLLPDAA